MTKNRAIDEYFNKLCSVACGNRYREHIYRNLLWCLYNKEFRYSIPRDGNRAEDGLDLRYRFGFEKYIDGPCSVLEMMLALAIRCEETIMDNPDIGDRTSQWFWQMIINLGLGEMQDNNYDEAYVENIIEQFLDRDYSPDGEGGLFYIPNCSCDMRDMEIWSQLCWYLDEYDSDY